MKLQKMCYNRPKLKVEFLLLVYFKRVLLGLLFIFLIGNLIWGIRSFFLAHHEQQDRTEQAVITPLALQKSMAEPRDAQLKIKNALKKIQHQHQLRVGMLNRTSRRYVDYFSINQLDGFEVAVLKKFADDLKVDLKIHLVDNIESLFKMAENDEIDLIAAEIKVNLPKTLASTFTATQPYHSLDFQLVYQKNSNKINQLSTLTGTLSVPKSSLQALFLKQQKRINPQNWQEHETLNDEALLELVSKNQLDYTILDHRTFSLMRRIYPDVKVAFDIETNYPEVWYIKSTDKSLLNAANQFIKKGKKTHLFETLEQHYLVEMSNEEWFDARHFVKSIQTKLPKFLPYFKEFADLYTFDWKMLAAISYQESHWNHDAKSSTGVRGLMMLTEPTAKAMGILDREDPKQSIQGGAKFFDVLINKMDDKIAEDQKILYALAAYNMGYSHLLDARQLALMQNKDPNDWRVINDILPLLTQKEYYSKLKYGYARAYQAMNYVKGVQRYYLALNYYFDDENESPKVYFSQYKEENAL